jgi:hypothetical protein
VLKGRGRSELKRSTLPRGNLNLARAGTRSATPLSQRVGGPPGKRVFPWVDCQREEEWVEPGEEESSARSGHVWAFAVASGWPPRELGKRASTPWVAGTLQGRQESNWAVWARFVGWPWTPPLPKSPWAFSSTAQGLLARAREVRAPGVVKGEPSSCSGKTRVAEQWLAGTSGGVPLGCGGQWP